MRTALLGFLVFFLAAFSFAHTADAASSRFHTPFYGTNREVVLYHTYPVHNFRCLRLGHDGQCVHFGEEIVTYRTERRTEARSFLVPQPSSVSPRFTEEHRRTPLPRERCVPERDRIGRVIRVHCAPFESITSADVTRRR